VRLLGSRVRRGDAALGTDSWYDAFYRRIEEPDLLNERQEQVTKASVETIGAFFLDRMRGVFAGVSEHAGVLRNSTNCPPYLLCFAVGNEKGKPTALRIANHLLKGLT